MPSPKVAPAQPALPLDVEQSSVASSRESRALNPSTADLLKFLIDRTGYIKLLEAEDTPEAFSRIENLRELVNAAADSRDRGETLDQFLDHAALIAIPTITMSARKITLMSLHAAKGLEFPLVFLSGLEEGLFPHSRTMLQPDDVEEERRLCYVGMTRAMDQLILTRAVYRRRYGTDLPEASVPSRFLEEVPAPLIEELGRRRSATAYAGTGTLARPAGRSPAAYDAADTHYSYEDEDQSANWKRSGAAATRQKPTAPAKPYNSIENIAEFFASRGKKFTVPKCRSKSPTEGADFGPDQKVRHPEIWRRNGLSARRRRRRSQDYGTISSLRLEEAGGEVCAVGARVERQSTNVQKLETTIRIEKRISTAFMANTAELTKEERKKSKRAARKKSKAEKPKKPRDYARGSKKPKVKKLARGQSKR